MSNSLLSTMAILLANYDAERDYFSNFEPFVLDCLREWPERRPVKPMELRTEIAGRFSLPDIPINTVTMLRERAARGGYLRRRGQEFYPLLSKLQNVPEIAPERTETLAHFNALRDSVREYAQRVYGREWSTQQTEAALEAFVDEFGVEMAIARHAGTLRGDPQTDQALTIVHSYARRALDRDPVSLGYLEEMVKGSMLTNVVYFQDLGTWTDSLDKLVVYIDTPLALKLLGMEEEERSSAALELLRMMAEFSIPVRIFEHTVEEVMGVLGGIKHGLQRARRRDLDGETVGAFNRETVEHLLERDVAPSDIEELMSDLGERLRQLGILTEPTPAVRRGLSLNERRFEEVLAEAGYTKDAQKAKDVRSLTAIHRLRDGRAIQELSSAPAVFLTSNPRLVKASRQFFTAEGHASKVAHCISDVSFTTQLWLRRPEAGSQVPRKLLMAESYAALRPPPEMWSRYLRKIEKRREQGDIDDRQVKVLVLSNAGREGLLEVTGGDPDAITDETPIEVLSRYEEVVTRATTEDRDAAVQSREELRAENEKLKAEAADLRGQTAARGEQLDKLAAEFKQHVDKVAERDKSRAQSARLVRASVGVGIAIAAVAGTLAPIILDAVSRPWIITIYVVLGGAIAVAAIGIGLHRSFGWIWRAIVAVGVVVGIIGAIYGVAADQSDPASESKAGVR